MDYAPIAGKGYKAVRIIENKKHKDIKNGFGVIKEGTTVTAADLSAVISTHDTGMQAATEAGRLNDELLAKTIAEMQAANEG